MRQAVSERGNPVHYPDNLLYMKDIMTPIGEICAGADEKGLHFLYFKDTEKYLKNTKYIAAAAAGGGKAVIEQLEAELAAYFSGQSQAFHTPLYMQPHSAFHRAAWAALLAIPFGQTRSYTEQAAIMGRAGNFSRAVAGANGKNPFSIIVPCHRVIGANGALTGYNGGLWRKEKLLQLEGVLLS